MIEFIFSFVIYALIALLLIAIGIGQIKSKEPVGFYTHEIGVTIVPLPIAMWYHPRLKKKYYR